MPTYSYACTTCDHKFDAVQAFSDDALTTCPECSGRLRKLFNSVGVVFKGSGFYRTDSRDSQKSSSSAASGSSGSPDKSPEKSPEKSSEKSSDKSSAKSSETSSAGSSSTAAAATSS